MLVSVAAETVSAAVPAMPEAASVALTVVLPAATLVASPWLPAAFETVATPVFDEVHVTVAVTSFVDASL